jgi:hypothetical protein
MFHKTRGNAESLPHLCESGWTALDSTRLCWCVCTISWLEAYARAFIHVTYRLRQKHLTVFEIWKATWLCAAFVQTIMYSDVCGWDGALFSATPHSAVELCIKIESDMITERGFRQQFQRHDVPSHITLLFWVSKWHQEGSGKDSKPQGRLFSAPAPNNVKRVMSAAVPLLLQTLMTCTVTTLPLPLIHMYYINILAILWV